MDSEDFKKLFDEFRKLPEWDRYPLPDAVYKKFGISKPIVSSDLKSYLSANAKIANYLLDSVETREPSVGGARILEDGSVLPIEVKLDDISALRINTPGKAEPQSDSHPDEPPEPVK